MRIVRSTARVFVYGTEDEERVVVSLLDLLGKGGDPQARGKLTRNRIKGHYGAEILLYEGVLKHPKELDTFLKRLRSSADVVSTLKAEFDERIDEANVLHFRIDKQLAVDGRLAIGTGGDAIDVSLKYAKIGPATRAFP